MGDLTSEESNVHKQQLMTDEKESSVHQQQSDENEKRYKCDVCSYSAKYSWNLKKHQMKHTGEKPFSCDMCHYSATESWHLRQHKLKHTGERPYSMFPDLEQEVLHLPSNYKPV